jgi:hypothetical protein
MTATSKGSQTTWGSMPRTCAGCGEKLSMRRDSLWLDTARRQSWHSECKLAAIREKVARREGGER